ncbi:MAG: G8 domain-containing protein [Kiritimatiellae bacterium]|nr:G8 domain-containing protein [Kiritimatiellia bacterium]
MSNNTIHAMITGMFTLGLCLTTVQAGTKTWNTTTGDWSVDLNWSGGVPVAGDDVVIANAGAAVSLTNSAVGLASLTIDHATLSFSNANATLSATNLSILNGGTQTCWGAVSCGECLLNGGTLLLNATTSGPVLDCSGSLTLTNAGRLYVSAGLSVAGAGAGYGGLVNVGGDIRVAANSWIYPATHPTNGAAVLFQMQNLVLDNGGGINADARGYIGSRAPGPQYYSPVAKEYGPGYRATAYWGALGSGYGGVGGRSRSATPGGPTYGSSYTPVAPGSGCLLMNGIMERNNGADGGGSVQIRATDTVTVRGTITANGAASPYIYFGGGASGGGIYITCGTFIGSSSGVLSANGGAGGAHDLYGSGGGGGGRIAVWRDIDNSPSAIATYVNGGAKGGNVLDEAGANGTVVWAWTSRTRMWTATTGDWSVAGNWLGGVVPAAGDDVIICVGGTVSLTNSTPWLSSLRTEHATLSFSNANATLNVTNLIVREDGTQTCWGAVNCVSCELNGGALVLNPAPSGPLFTCTGDLTLTNAGRLHVTAGLSVVGAEADYGALVSVGGNIRVATNSWIYPAAHPTNGAAVLFTMRNLTLNGGGGINADCLGYMGSPYDGSSVNPQGAFGPGSAANTIYWACGGGSGYGGAGGSSQQTYPAPGGPAYGSSNAPVAPGSGAFRWSGGSPYTGRGLDGGGSVQLRATDTVVIQGTITANGQAGNLYRGGGASGGGIYIRCHNFIGDSSGILRANGGNGYTHVLYGSGGGGGGRIAVWRAHDRSLGSVTTYVNGGTAGGGEHDEAGSNGTVVFGWVPPPGTILLLY